MNCYSKAIIPTQYGQFTMMTYSENEDNAMPHVVLSNMEDKTTTVNVRIHSECMTGDLFGSYRCDCGEQLNASLAYLQQYKGVLIYLRQEGRGIGIINKLKAYQLQDEGMDTADANLHLGYSIDSRDYLDAIEILKDLGVKRINLLTNNPEKISAFDGTEIELVERIPLVIPTKKENEAYFETKKNKMGHLL